MIETIEGNHSFNLDELLSYLLREKEIRHETALANMKGSPERYIKEKAMENNYRRWYVAVSHYREQADT